jgi:hypothetical protein
MISAMPAPQDQVRRFAFAFPRLDTVAAVEASPAAVVIRLSRDTFTAARKHCFVCELAAEGFVDERVRWFEDDPTTVRWVVDRASFMPSAACRRRTTRLMLGAIAAGSALWCTLLVAAVAGWLH